MEFFILHVFCPSAWVWKLLQRKWSEDFISYWLCQWWRYSKSFFLGNTRMKLFFFKSENSKWNRVSMLVMDFTSHNWQKQYLHSIARLHLRCIDNVHPHYSRWFPFFHTVPTDVIDEERRREKNSQVWIDRNGNEKLPGRQDRANSEYETSGTVFFSFLPLVPFIRKVVLPSSISFRPLIISHSNASMCYIKYLGSRIGVFLGRIRSTKYSLIYS